MRAVDVVWVVCLVGCSALGGCNRQTERAQGEARVVTMGDYDRLQPGMNEVQVRNEIDQTPKAITSNATGERTTIYRWTNGDGSYLAVTFHGDGLVQKSQSRLPE